MKFRKFLKNLRLSKNYTQKEMALRLITSQGYYSQIERGTMKPGIQFIKKVSLYSGKSVEELREML